MSQSGTSQKRRRTNDDTSVHPSVVLRRSSRLYFPDGNIIIKTPIPLDTPVDLYQITFSDERLDNPSSALLYRVHTGVLASQCGFFSSLFGGSQEAFGDASEKYDNAPIMELPGDDWQAVDDFLKAMYIPNYLSHHSNPPSIRGGDDSIKLLGGILTLAKKYDALEMHALAAHLLETQWPSHYLLWESDRKARLLHLDAARAINLGSAHAIHPVLPVAFYEAHMACAHKPNHPALIVDHVEPDLSLLSAEDLRRLVKGGAAFNGLCQAVFCELEKTLNTCKQCIVIDKDCPGIAAYQPFIHSSTLGTVDYECRTMRPFMFLRLLGDDELRGLCKPCQNVVRNQFKHQQRRLWESLPKVFGLVDLVGEDWGKEN